MQDDQRSVSTNPSNIKCQAVKQSTVNGHAVTVCTLYISDWTVLKQTFYFCFYLHCWGLLLLSSSTSQHLRPNQKRVVWTKNSLLESVTFPLTVKELKLSSFIACPFCTDFNCLLSPGFAHWPHHAVKVKRRSPCTFP